MNKILIKRGERTPTISDLEIGEIAYDQYNDKLYIRTRYGIYKINAESSE